jgi:hypothetical protein
MASVSQKARKQLGLVFADSRKSRQSHRSRGFLALFSLYFPEIERTDENYRPKRVR